MNDGRRERGRRERGQEPFSGCRLLFIILAVGYTPAWIIPAGDAAVFFPGLSFAAQM